MIWLGLIVLLSWGAVGCVCVCEQSPRTSLLRGLFSRCISLSVMALLGNVWESFPFRWLYNLTSHFWILIINSTLHGLFVVLRRFYKDFPMVAVDACPMVVIGVKCVSTFVDWGDQSLVQNIEEDARAEDDVKEFKYSQLEFLVCIFINSFRKPSTPQAFLGWRVCILSCRSFNVIGKSCVFWNPVCSGIQCVLESSMFWKSLIVDSKICI